MNNPSVLEQTPLVFFKKCEQLVHKQKKKFEMNYKQVSLKQKHEIMKISSMNERAYLHDKTLVKPLSYSRYFNLLP
jgi:hypothetical protein